MTGIAYETVQLADGSLPLLAPMSEVAGAGLSIQEGAHLLESNLGGRGILLGGVPGVERAHVVIIGGGNEGTNAAKIAVGMGADVTVLDLSVKRLAYLDDIFRRPGANPAVHPLFHRPDGAGGGPGGGLRPGARGQSP